MNWKTFLLLLPILIICNQGFWWGFYKAPNFMLCWAIGSVIAATLGWLSNIFVLKEPYNYYQIVGYSIVLFGLFIMKVKG